MEFQVEREAAHLLSVWGQEILFYIFIVLIGVILKGVVKRSLLFKDELLTLDIDGFMPV